MGAYLDMAAANAVAKELVGPQAVEEEIYKKNPALALLNKYTEFGGKYFPQPVIFAPSAGASSTFANAQGNQAPAQMVTFQITNKSDYSISTVDRRTMLSINTDKMGFIRAMTVARDMALRASVQNLAHMIFRSGTGTRGQISTISTGVITLTNDADVVNFEINMVLLANSSDGGNPRTAAGYVVARDVTAGTVTVSTSQGGAAATPGSWAANDYLLRQGDNNNLISGFSAWWSTTAPASSDNFYGPNRSVEAWRLGGGRYDGSAQSIEDAFIDGELLLEREGGDAKVIVTGFKTYGALKKSLGTKVQYTDIESRDTSAAITFKAIELEGGLNVVRDRYCPPKLAYALDLDHITLGSLNEAPHFFTDDGLQFLRVYNADAYELRCGLYGNIWTDAPGWSAVLQTSV